MSDRQPSRGGLRGDLDLPPAAGRRHLPVAHKRRPDDGSPTGLSVVLAGNGGGFDRSVLDLLAGQTAPRRSFEIVCVGTADGLPREALDLVDTLLTLPFEAFAAGPAYALNTAIEAASGGVVAFVDPAGPPLPPTLVADVLEIFFAAPVAAVGRSNVVPKAWVYRSGEYGVDGCDVARVVACPAAWARRVGGFDDHPSFSDRGASAAEFVWRLEKCGLPVLRQRRDGCELGSARPWWDDGAGPRDAGAGTASGRAVEKVLRDPARVAPVVGHFADGHSFREAVLIGTYGQFNLLIAKGRVYAISRTAGRVDFRVFESPLVDGRTLASFVQADSIDGIRLAIDALPAGRKSLDVPPVSRPPPAPVLLDPVGQYNVVGYDGRYFGLHRGLGPVDLTVGREPDDPRLRPPMFLEFRDHEELKSAITAAEHGGDAASPPEEAGPVEPLPAVAPPAVRGTTARSSDRSGDDVQWADLGHVGGYRIMRNQAGFRAVAETSVARPDSHGRGAGGPADRPPQTLEASSLTELKQSIETIAGLASAAPSGNPIGTRAAGPAGPRAPAAEVPPRAGLGRVGKFDIVRLDGRFHALRSDVAEVGPAGPDQRRSAPVRAPGHLVAEDLDELKALIGAASVGSE